MSLGKHELEKERKARKIELEREKKPKPRHLYNFFKISIFKLKEEKHYILLINFTIDDSASHRKYGV